MKYIQNIKSLEELSIWDYDIRLHCKRNINNLTYDDLVNDMYIKLDRLLKKGTILNGGYIHLCLKTLDLNHKRRQRYFDELPDIPMEEDEYEGRDIYGLVEMVKQLLSTEELCMWTYYKMNSLELTSEKYEIPIPQMRYKLKIIRNKIKTLK